MRKPNVNQIALAFAKADKHAGASWDCFERLSEPPLVRAHNLVNQGYIQAGDPAGWSSGGKPIATVFVEPNGGEGDCVPPADYYSGRWPDITPHLPGYYWEWVNAAVALVWPI